MENVFRKDLIWLDEAFETQTLFFETMGKRLYEKGLVKENFGQALIAREENFPTGLKTEAYEIAIPHTDVEYVEEACISFVRFCSPIRFSHMGEPGIKVDAKFAFVLGIKDPKRQVEVLSTLVKLISDEKMMAQLEIMDSVEEISDTLNKFFEENM